MKTVITDLIDNIALKQWKTYEQASRIVFGDGITPGIWEKFWWLDSRGQMTAKAIEKTNQWKEGRKEVRSFAKSNNISVDKVTHGKNWKPTFWR